MYDFILLVHVLVAVALIVLVLLQQGKGAEMGAAFGAGASQTLFGSQGSGNFLSRTTAICATIFFSTSLLLGHLGTNEAKEQAAALLPVAPISAPAENNVPTSGEPQADKALPAAPAPSHSDVPEVE